MKVEVFKTEYQVYLTPYIKLTTDRYLTGNLELIFGWLNRELVFSIWKKDQWNGLKKGSKKKSMLFGTKTLTQ